MTKAFFVILPVTDPGGENRPPEPAGFSLTKQGGRWVLYYGDEPNMQPLLGQRVGRSTRRRDVRPYVWLEVLLQDTPNSRAFFVVAGDSLPMLKYLKNRADAAGMPSWTKAQLIADDSTLASNIKAALDPEDIAKLRRIFAGEEGTALNDTAAAEIDGATPVEE